MWEYVHTDELYHYGVLGMKWGKRKAQYEKRAANIGRTRKAYKDSKKELRNALKEQKKAKRWAFGKKGLERVEAATNKANQAYLKSIDAKAEYKASKSNDANKARLKTYSNEMYKSGLAGSAKDAESGGKSTLLRNHLRTKKGKQYADKVEKKVEDRAATTLVATGAATVALGAAIVADMIKR